MGTIQERIVVVEGKEIAYQLEQKSVKNLNLRIRKDGSVYVSAHKAVPLSQVDAFVVNKGAYILNAIDKFKELSQYAPQPKQFVSGESFYIQGRSLRLQVSQSEKESVTSDGIYLYLRIKDTGDTAKKRHMVTKYLDQQCREVFREVLDEFHPTFQKYGVKMPLLRIRDMETRWGSCSVKRGLITLNKRLLEAPRNCIEYVTMHELCHFIHPNHSKQFYSFLTMLMPDWKERKQALDKRVMYWL